MWLTTIKISFKSIYSKHCHFNNIIPVHSFLQSKSSETQYVSYTQKTSQFGPASSSPQKPNVADNAHTEQCSSTAILPVSIPATQLQSYLQ